MICPAINCKFNTFEHNEVTLKQLETDGYFEGCGSCQCREEIHLSLASSNSMKCDNYRQLNKRK